MSTQTDNNAWLDIWTEEISQQLNLIEESIIETVESLQTLLEDLNNITDEIQSHKEKLGQDQRLMNLEALVNAKKRLLFGTKQWRQLVENTIESNDEFKILQLLELAPKGAPFTKRLKDAYKHLMEKQQNSPEEVEVSESAAIEIIFQHSGIF